MSPLSELLQPGERIEFEGGEHKVGRIPLIVIGVLLLPLWGLGLIVLLVAWGARDPLQVMVTDRRLLVRKTFPSKKFDELPIAHIQSVQFEGDPTGSFAGATVTGSGGTKVEMTLLARPAEFQAAINRARSGNEKGNG